MKSCCESPFFQIASLAVDLGRPAAMRQRLCQFPPVKLMHLQTNISGAQSIGLTERLRRFCPRPVIRFCQIEERNKVERDPQLARADDDSGPISALLRDVEHSVRKQQEALCIGKGAN